MAQHYVASISTVKLQKQVKNMENTWQAMTMVAVKGKQTKLHRMLPYERQQLFDVLRETSPHTSTSFSLRR